MRFRCCGQLQQQMSQEYQQKSEDCQDVQSVKDKPSPLVGFLYFLNFFQHCALIQKTLKL